MALLDSEVAKIKWHLGYNGLTIASEPYILHAAVFDQVIQPYTQAGLLTSSSTEVDAATSPEQVGLVLASATGLSVGDKIVVDVDSRMETATIQSISGSTVYVLLKNAHTGTYPVSEECGETIIRNILSKLDDIIARIQSAASSAGLKRAEDIEWYQANSSGKGGVIETLQDLFLFWREELASVLGLPKRGGGGGRGGGSVELY